MAAPKTAKSGTEIVAFLKSFEGAASAFTDASDTWALWIPEIATGEHPVTPGTQVYFPVILRQGQRLITIQFFYDCRTGKIKFYTGAIPSRLSALPEFEHAVSELFRHSLPVEPIKQRQLRRVELVSPATPVVLIERPVERLELRQPVAAIQPAPVEIPPAEAPVSAEEPLRPEPPCPPASVDVVQQLVPRNVEASPTPLALAIPSSPQPTLPRVVQRETLTKVKVEICSGTTRVLQVLILVLGILGITAIAAFVYLQITEDPGLKHHRLQIEQMRLR